ncbi:MAG: hypothetical protein J6A94_02460 [Lachnospiraceae bacterium]|nr:hypothetical protein [Lachnospiraceae bacterium]
MSNLQIATITRTQDFTTIKQNEDNKGFIHQTTIGQEQKKEIEHRMRDVHSSDNADWHNKKFDAKEKGSNEYHGNGGSKKPKQKTTDRVVVKGQQGFDVKI